MRKGRQNEEAKDSINVKEERGGEEGLMSIITYDQMGICAKMVHTMGQQAHQITRRHKQQPRLGMFFSHPIPQS